MSLSSESATDEELLDQNVLDEEKIKDKKADDSPDNSISKLKFGIFLAGFDEDKAILEKIQDFMVEEITRTTNEVEILDPKLPEYNFNFATLPMYRILTMKDVPSWMIKANRTIEECDAFVIVCMEKYQTLPPVLIQFMNFFPRTSYEYKPCGVCSYSCTSTGGVIAAYHLKHYLSFLGCAIMPFELNIPCVRNVFNDRQVVMNEKFVADFERFFDVLQWFTKAIKVYKWNNGPPKQPGPK